jgi:GMP synthase-like glutamine amidotransferase
MAEDAAVFNSLPQQLMAFYWHGDTFDLPPGAMQLDRVKGCNEKAVGVAYRR